jgi:PQQ-dependent dehydrogenase (methanol/ethanol family)
MLHGNDDAEQRFSRLSAINEQNVSELGLAWSYDMGTYRGLEATPIVVDGRLYVTGNWGVVHALDAASGKRVWLFNPQVPGLWGRYGCCDVVNRGVAVWDNKVFVASFDGRLFALNSDDGKVLWEVDTIDAQPPYTITGAPRVVDGKVLIGNGGADYGVRGYISAYDAISGDLVWRFYTVPGDPSLPFEQPELQMAAETWAGGEWWKAGGGGTVWDSMAYDAENSLLYFGVGNGSPWPRAIRSPGGGDNLFLSSIVAVRPDTGEYVWHYQTTPGDSWDYTATQHMVLADLTIENEVRKVLMQAPKNGFFYVLDRITGELLSAEKYVAVNWASHVDVSTGRPVNVNTYGTEPSVVLPSPAGGHNWQPMSYNPESGLVYIPTRDLAGLFALSQECDASGKLSRQPGWWNIGMDWQTYTDIAESIHPGDIPVSHGILKAWDPVTHQVAWEFEHSNVWNGGVLATAGKLVFQGAGDGIFRAHQADNGKVLWSANVMTGMVAAPITYSIDGEQFVAVLAGWGGTAIAGGDARTSAAAKYGNNGRLLVFKLGGASQLPELPIRDQTIEAIEIPPLVEQKVKAGARIFMQYCSLCHGSSAISSGVIPDLRRMSSEVRKQFVPIVLEGQREVLGMPNFSNLLSEEDVKMVYQYILYRTQESTSQ